MTSTQPYEISSLAMNNSLGLRERYCSRKERNSPGPRAQSASFSSFNEDEIREICETVINDMNAFGVCVIDKFLGSEKGLKVLQEVVDLQRTGVFQDGQLVSNRFNTDHKIIRSDRIAWLDKHNKMHHTIDYLIKKIDKVIFTANCMRNNGKLGSVKISSRSKPMVACYPGDGSHYVTHVDNPNKDGRCITAIYYLNRDWDCRINGGLLRIFPQGMDNHVANIEPIFDRLLFFWSDRRNPHEVQPSFRTRYAITLWYHDAVEIADASKRLQQRGQ